MGASPRQRWTGGQDAVYTALRKRPCQLSPLLPPLRCEDGEETLIRAEKQRRPGFLHQTKSTSFFLGLFLTLALEIGIGRRSSDASKQAVGCVLAMAPTARRQVGRTAAAVAAPMGWPQSK